ncbi:MAG: DUF3883 domain-containing protein [Sulfurimonas sp.]|nr:DUF3883 domain-containing protein [Sulfurimonas sp.]
MISNPKSDVIAKNEYMKILELEGYENIRVTSAPSDIQASKNGINYYFEIKFTTKEQKYFGAATLTEWKSAIENQDTYHFVIAIIKNDSWIFTKYTCDEFMQFSNIPPFKVFFNIPDTTVKSLPANKKTKSVVLTKNRLKKMIDVFEHLRENS